MQNISVTRYPNPKAVGWSGYIEPADRSWIAFIGVDGRPVFFLHRHPVTGSVLPDDPTERLAEIAEIDAELARGGRGTHTGETATERADGSALAPGHVCFPLGVDGTGGVGVQ